MQMSCWSTLNMMEVMKRKLCSIIYMIDDDNKSINGDDDGDDDDDEG